MNSSLCCLNMLCSLAFAGYGCWFCGLGDAGFVKCWKHKLVTFGYCLLFPLLALLLSADYPSPFRSACDSGCFQCFACEKGFSRVL